MKNLCLLIIGDGRDEVHERAVASLEEHVCAQFKRTVLQRVIIDDREHGLGFAGAIAEGWRQVADCGVDWCLHFEADFIFNGPVPVARMVAVLKRHPYLAQISLKRQPCNVHEREAGGFVELRADEYQQKVEAGDIWTEHRVCFSTNPSVYPAALCHQGWPQEEASEGIFTHRLLEDPEVRFGIWGAKFDDPLVEHIGAERAGRGY